MTPSGERAPAQAGARIAGPVRRGRRRPRGGASAPEERRRFGVLLASEGRSIPDVALAEAAELAREQGTGVYVFSIARVWGTGLGMPMPGLLPTKAEWDTQHGIVAAAVQWLRRRGVAAEGRVVGTRRGTRRILAEAEHRGCTAIVMGADPPRNRLLADFMWSQEPYRVKRRAGVPVHIVVGP